jgi:hypothetical protein
MDGEYNYMLFHMDIKLGVTQRESSVGIVMGYGLDVDSQQAKIFSFPQCLDWIWGPPSLLSSGYWG